MAEESCLQAAMVNPDDEERLSGDWTEDWTDDDYCSVISSDKSDCLVTTPPFSPVAKDNANASLNPCNGTCKYIRELCYKKT